MKNEKRLEEMLNEIKAMFLDEKGMFDVRNISVEEAQTLTRISHIAGRLGSETSKRSYNVHDIILVEWADGWKYPLIISKVNPKRVQATYLYASGKMEHYNVPFNMIKGHFSGSFIECLEQLEKYIETNEEVANFESVENAKVYMAAMKLSAR